MAGGQAIDLESVGKKLSVPELELMHIHKTGALIRASALLGARCGNALDDEKALAQLDTFAKLIGLAFQVVDDVLDAEAPTATLGQDRRQGRGPEQAHVRERARRRAIEELSPRSCGRTR